MIDTLVFEQQFKEIILEAGVFLRTTFTDFDAKKVEKKGLNDLVSYADKECENLLVNGLKNLLPPSGFITEEGTIAHQQADYEWVIDPLDGTTNFIHGLPVFAISVALMYHRKTILGAVYHVMTDEFFFGNAKGAFLNEQTISVSNKTNLSDSLVATGFPYTQFEQLPKYLEVLGELMQKTHGLRRMGSAAIDLAYVACGRFDCFFEYNLKPWDVAAGAFIVQQAGGSITRFNGDADYVFCKSIMAGPKPLMEELRPLIAGIVN